MAKNKRMLVSILVIILGLVIIFLFMNSKNSDPADAVKTENKVETKSEENNKSVDQNIQKENDEATPDIKLDPNQEVREANDYQDAPEQADTEVDFEE